MKVYFLYYLIILITLLLAKPAYELGKIIGKMIREKVDQKGEGRINENNRSR
jgi:hypothetical protein